jgi:hypothetical protein
MLNFSEVCGMVYEMHENVLYCLMQTQLSYGSLWLKNGLACQSKYPISDFKKIYPVLLGTSTIIDLIPTEQYLAD